MSYVYDEDQFCCSVCLEILRDPVTIPCGHSYCMECIKGYWRKTEHKTGYSCPQCRRGFNPRPVLARNTMLAELVNKLREAGVQEGPHPGPLRAVDMVECDICSGRRRKAVKSWVASNDREVQCCNQAPGSNDLFLIYTPPYIKLLLLFLPEQGCVWSRTYPRIIGHKAIISPMTGYQSITLKFSEGLSGRSYWEVEWSGNGGITIGVAYKGIVRNSGGTDSKLGCNSKSWSLDLADGLCTFQHNKTKLEIPTPISPRIGVYLDHKTGTLAFYCVSPRGDTMTLLHRVQTTFSQPLYPGFWVGLGSTLKFPPISDGLERHVICWC
uniref:Uncharacterized protein n=1 Tax=Astyanax mexicanus TaxID=7994 RepID=A0A3B1K4C1_ASTMX